MREYFYRLVTDKEKGILVFFLKSLLLGLSLIYSVLLKIVLLFYRLKILKIHKLACRVISVGNITWGGTGKTPVVRMLTKYLVEQGKRPAIIIRGYKSTPGQAYKQKGDEAFMLREELAAPVISDRNRVASGKKAINDFKADTLILDDGFQHWRLSRDLNIVTIDCTNPFGNGCIIPRGILREPLSGLRRADVFFLTKTNLSAADIGKIKDKLVNINPFALMVESIHKPVGFYNLLKKEESLGIDKIKDKDVCLVCGIGNPAALEKTTLSLKLNPVLKFFFLDHHDYKKEEVIKIIDSCSRFKINTIITTSKDAVKLKDHFMGLAPTQKILVLDINIAITKGKDEFLSRLSRLYSA